MNDAEVEEQIIFVFVIRSKFNSLRQNSTFAVQFIRVLSVIWWVIHSKFKDTTQLEKSHTHPLVNDPYFSINNHFLIRLFVVESEVILGSDHINNYSLDI